MRSLSEIRGFGPKRLSALESRGVCDARDLVERLPVGYKDTTRPLSPAQMTDGMQACWPISSAPSSSRTRAKSSNFKISFLLAGRKSTARSRGALAPLLFSVFPGKRGKTGAFSCFFPEKPL